MKVSPTAHFCAHTHTITLPLLRAAHTRDKYIACMVVCFRPRTMQPIYDIKRSPTPACVTRFFFNKYNYHITCTHTYAVLHHVLYKVNHACMHNISTRIQSMSCYKVASCTHMHAGAVQNDRNLNLTSTACVYS